MASQAQIDANRRNAQRSTGPKPRPARPAPSSMHSRTAPTPKPCAPSCHRKTPSSSTSASTSGSTSSTRATTPNESWSSRRRSWPGPSTGPSGPRPLEWPNACARRCSRPTQQRYEEVGELGRRLLYNTEAKPLPTPGRRWEDNPAAFLKGLESSAEGCRWLLDHWIGLRVLLDRISAWTYGDMFRLIRLLGKYPVEAINDPKLNAIFLAWDAVVPGWAERFWKECKKCKPVHDPGFSDFGRWREIAERPADAAAATTFFERLMDEQVARLEELLEVHEEIAGDDPAELADCASFDGSAEGERLRRSLSAQRRELRQTLELLMKMQKSEDNGHAAGDGGNDERWRNARRRRRRL